MSYDLEQRERGDSEYTAIAGERVHWLGTAVARKYRLPGTQLAPSTVNVDMVWSKAKPNEGTLWDRSTR
jgi:hypothetical protein